MLIQQKLILGARFVGPPLEGGHHEWSCDCRKIKESKMVVKQLTRRGSERVTRLITPYSVFFPYLCLQRYGKPNLANEPYLAVFLFNVSTAMTLCPPENFILEILIFNW